MLGVDGVENLSKEASKLAVDQKLLMDNMNKLQDMMPQINNLMNNMGGIDKMMGNVKNLLGDSNVMSNIGSLISNNSGLANKMGNPEDMLKNMGSMLNSISSNGVNPANDINTKLNNSVPAAVSN